MKAPYYISMLKLLETITNFKIQKMVLGKLLPTLKASLLSFVT